MARNKGKRSEGQYVQMPYGVLKSPAWFELHTRFNGGNNGQIHLSMNEASEALSIGKGTVQRAFKDLQDKGFIALETQGSWYSRRAHEWRLTTKPMQRFNGKEMATDNWRQWRPEKTERGSETDLSESLVVPFENPKRVAGSK